MMGLILGRVAGDSLVGKTVEVTMTTVRPETLIGDNGRKVEKFVLCFKETPKGLVLNKTNAKVIAKTFGGETDNWQGHKLELFTEQVSAFGADHNAVRVRCLNGVVSDEVSE